ncbi:MAG: hypothetical protein NVSMB9_33180 [Isosphaeraceae bacterium]
MSIYKSPQHPTTLGRVDPAGRKPVDARLMQAIKRGGRVFIFAEKNRIETQEEARIEVEFGIDAHSLPRGLLVGMVEIVGCEPLVPDHARKACFEVTEETGGYVGF